MLFGTLLGVFVIPTLYIIFQSLQEKLRGTKTKDEAGGPIEGTVA
jgi:HAE1 family hydrophobic/amphiphilic exporter-1